MAIPNYKTKIQQVRASGDYDLSTLEGCARFTRACAVFIYAQDKRFVMLKKSSGRTHAVDGKGRLHAVDALLFLENGKGTSVDIIGNSRTDKASPAWTPDSKVRYGLSDSFIPDYGTDPKPEPEPFPEPLPSDLEGRVDALERKFAAIKAAL